MDALRYRLAYRPQCPNVFDYGRLGMQYTVDGWARYEQNKLNFLRANQVKLRVDKYKGAIQNLFIVCRVQARRRTRQDHQRGRPAVHRVAVNAPGQPSALQPSATN